MRKPALYYFWSSTHSQRIRMALSAKKVVYDENALSFWEDEVFFELGVARQVPILKMPNGELYTDANNILWSIDQLFPDTIKLVNARIDAAAWQALLEWRKKVDAVLSRLLAPALLNFIDIAESDESTKSYKKSIRVKYRMSTEELANDRYAAFDQFSKLTNIRALGHHLSEKKFYMEQLSIADILIAADLYPLQCLDGVSLPIDILYYLARVEKACGIDMQEGFKTRLM